tara:strand:- start:355 stop:2640 length:2286 start_codon:yes stop_codon:yes gene_type:complete
MSQNYSPKVSTNGLVFAFDGTQGFKGANQVRRPTTFGGCALWLDASDEDTVITSGNNVTNWLDKSGNNNDAAVSGTLYPQYDGTTVSNKKAVDFVPTSLSSGDTIKGSFSTSGSNQPGQSGGYSTFMVFKQRKFSGSATQEFAGIMEMAQGAFGTGSYGVRTIIQTFGSGYSGGGSVNKVRIARSGAGASINASWSGGANNGYRANDNITLVSNVHNNGTSAQAWCNGYRGGNETSTVDSNTYTHYCIGDDMTAGDAFNGQICEVIVYNKVLTDTERMAVEFYLARKWDVANYALGRESYERVPVDLTNNASIDTSVGSFTQFAPGIQPGRGIVYQNDSGRRLYFDNQAATANIGTTGTVDEMSIEFAATHIAQDDSGTNYEIISNELYQNYGFIVRYGGNAYGRLHIRTSDSSASPTQTSLDVDNADKTVSGEWAIWQIIWQAGGASGYGCTCKVYKNGVVVKQSNSFNPPANSTKDLGAPFGSSSQAFCGELAYLRCYNRALSEEELLDNYLSMKQRIDAIPKIAAPTNVALYLDAHQYGRHQGSTVWYDMSPNEYEVTVSGPTMVNYFPKSYSFDGTDDFMSLGTSISATQTNMSYGFWINFDEWVTDSAYNQIYCEESGVWIANYYDKIGFDIHNGSTWVDTNGGTIDGLQITVPSAKQTNTWIYIVLVYEGSGSSTSANFRGYLDGEESFNVTTSFASGSAGNIYSLAGDIEIGKRAAGSGKYLPADLANVMVYQTSLTAAQVKQNYNYFKNRYGH